MKDLKKLRKEKNYTLQQLSDKSNISLRLIIRIEKNQCVPSLETKIQLFKALEISDDEIIDYVIKNYIKND